MGFKECRIYRRCMELQTTLGIRVESAKKNITWTKYPHSGVHYEEWVLFFFVASFTHFRRTYRTLLRTWNLLQGQNTKVAYITWRRQDDWSIVDEQMINSPHQGKHATFVVSGIEYLQFHLFISLRRSSVLDACSSLLFPSS